MTLDQLVGNLNTYEMNVDNAKRGERSKDKILSLTTTKGGEPDLDDEYITLVNRNFKKLYKTGLNYGKSPPSRKKRM